MFLVTSGRSHAVTPGSGGRAAFGFAGRAGRPRAAAGCWMMSPPRCVRSWNPLAGWARVANDHTSPRSRLVPLDTADVAAIRIIEAAGPWAVVRHRQGDGSLELAGIKTGSGRLQALPSRAVGARNESAAGFIHCCRLLEISSEVDLVESLLPQRPTTLERHSPAGRTIEWGSTATVFETPAHPYTVGLLHAAQADRGRDGRFVTISGDPPNLANMGGGCAFSPRCTYAMPRCVATMPGPTALAQGGGQTVRCWRYGEGAPNAASAVA
jgi:oligopeptide/dipeptide ABC transporter ATP-binding protein